MIQDVSDRWGMGLGVGLDLTSHSPRCFRMVLMTAQSSMKLIICMIPRHFGQAPIFWISLAQLFRYSFELLQFQLGEKEREAVEWGWEQEMGKTMFHVVSAYTRAAQFEGLPAEASYRLQKVGGAILGMVK